VIIIENVAVATVDAAGTEFPDGHVVVGDDGRIAAVGAGRPELPGERVDGAGCLVTPGLVNTHHHLYQWATRGLALDETLFGWLTTLYPIWGRLDAEIVGAAAGAGLGWLALSGCTTSMDHHYVFPRDGGDVLAA
jgi:cytosine/adenosine deaminase-related metal-dependent hydrolase